MKCFFLKKKDDVVVFKHSSFILRILNFFISIFILGSNIIGAVVENSYSFITIAVGLFCLIIALYQNSWAFNIKEGFILNKRGVLFINKKAKYGFLEVSSIIIEKFQRTGRRSEYTEISIQFEDGKTAIIESDKTKKLKDEIAFAKELQDIISHAKEYSASAY